MKYTRKHRCLILSLVFMAGLMLTLAPIHAHAATDGCTSESGHNWQHFNFADCTSGGADYYQCTNCNAIQNETWVDALGHSWSDWSTRMEPTCTESGTRYRQCNRCGTGETESIPARGHTPMRIAGTAATCTSGGSTEGSQCSVCGAVLTAQTDTPALGHSWDGGTVTTQPSCTAEGVRTYSCTRCGETRTEAIGKTGHSPTVIPAVAATCTSGGRTEGSQCSVCGTILTAQSDTPALGHSWDGGTVTTQPSCTAEGVRTYSCTRCGETRTEAIAKTGHSPTAIPAVAATCTSGGRTEGSQCSVCGEILSAQQSTPARGHAWGEGTVTREDTLLSGGEITRTCTRCGATETEELPVQQSPFNLLRLYGGGENASGGIGEQAAEGFDLSDYLRVVTQPVGGAISSGGDCILTTEAAGGVPPYTYEWHRAADLRLGMADSFVTSFVQSRSSHLAASYSRRKRGYASAFRKTRGGSSESAGTGKSIYSYGTAMYEKGLEQVDLDLNDRNLGSSDNPEYPATTPGSYYCIIRDSIGQWVSTDKAEVTQGLYIATQPRNANMNGKDTVTLTCAAAGGTPFGEEYDNAYVYYWFDGQGNNVGSGQQIEVSQEDEYYCVAEDAAMSQATSANCTVYSGEPLAVTMGQDVYPVDDPAHVAVEAEFAISGGAASYTCYWYLENELWDSFITNDAENMVVVIKPGTYTLTVFDAMGEQATGSCRVGEVEKLRVRVAGAYNFDETNSMAVYVAVEGGVPPYNYYLLRGDEVVVQSSGEAPNKGLGINEPGVYHFLVEDALGDTDESAPIMISGDGTPIILEQPRSVVLEYREDGNYGTQLVCNAVSGIGDDNVWYEWEEYTPRVHGWRVNLGNASFYPVSEPGTYRCKVTDRETGKSVYSETATVSVDISFDAEFLRDDGGIHQFYHLNIQGGTAPYTFEFYLLVPVHYDPNTYYFPTSEHMEVLVNTIVTEDNPYLLMKLRDQPVYYMDHGGHVEDFVFAYWRVVITDANGNSFSKIIPG